MATIPCAGHLVHEEKPEAVAELVREAARAAGKTAAA
jgi:pimeloyl-ACP methyl ester carboxylesterase